MRSNRVHVALRDATAEAAAIASSPMDDLDSTLVDDLPLGEIGGVMFRRDAKERYQEAGGAVYQRLHPFSLTANVTTSVCNDHRRRRAGSSSFLAKAARVVTKPLCIMMPLLRALLPTALTDLPDTSSIMTTHRCATGATGSGDAVVAMAFHEHVPALAIAVRDAAGMHRILLYDVAAEQLLPMTLSHAFQDAGVTRLKWKPKSKDCLIVGCVGGILVWSLGMRSCQQAAPASSFLPPTAPSPFAPDVQITGCSPLANFWKYVNDQSPACIFYTCEAGTLVTCIECSASATYVACGSAQSTSVCILDLSQPPHQSLVLQTSCLYGGCNSAAFANDDGFLVRSVSGAAKLQLVRLDERSCYESDIISTNTPVDACLLINKRERGPSLFVLQYRSCEGVAIVRFVFDRQSSTPGSSPSAVMLILSLVSSGMVRGIGGAVVSAAAHGRRIYLQVESQHIIVVAVSVVDGVVSTRSVGWFKPPSQVMGDAAVLATFQGFQRGSLVAVATSDTVDFVPSYYSR